jgi:hypothetical protein
MVDEDFSPALRGIGMTWALPRNLKTILNALSPSFSHLDASFQKELFDSPDRVSFVVNHGGYQGRIGAALREHLEEMLRFTGSTGSDDRNADIR